MSERQLSPFMAGIAVFAVWAALAILAGFIVAIGSGGAH